MAGCYSLISCRTFVQMHKSKGNSGKQLAFTHLFIDLFTYLFISTRAFAFALTNRNCIGLPAHTALHLYKGGVVFLLLKCKPHNMFNHLHTSECQQ